MSIKKCWNLKYPQETPERPKGLLLAKKKITYRVVDEFGQEKYYPLVCVKINQNFFSKWTNEMAYVLGFIYSDGNLYQDKKRNQSRLSISQNNPEMLEKIKRLMNCNAKILHTQRKEYESGISGELYKIQIPHNKIFNDLLKLGLTPNKSLTIKFPPIPTDFIRHFIRGCWDGDGSVYIEKKVNQIHASYISGSLEFIKGLLNELEKAGFRERKIYQLTRRSTSYYFRFTGIECKKLYHYLYENVPSGQYLERKYDIFYKNFHITPADGL